MRELGGASWTVPVTVPWVSAPPKSMMGTSVKAMEGWWRRQPERAQQRTAEAQNSIAEDQSAQRVDLDWRDEVRARRVNGPLTKRLRIRMEMAILNTLKEFPASLFLTRRNVERGFGIGRILRAISRLFLVI